MAEPSLTEIMKQAKEMESQMRAAQDELTKLEIIGTAGFGSKKITITMTGRHDAKAVNITDALMDLKEKNTLQDLIVAAVNDANRKIEKASRRKIMDLTKSMGLPEKFPKEDE